MRTGIPIFTHISNRTLRTWKRIWNINGFSIRVISLVRITELNVDFVTLYFHSLFTATLITLITVYIFPVNWPKLAHDQLMRPIYFWSHAHVLQFIPTEYFRFAAFLFRNRIGQIWQTVSQIMCHTISSKSPAKNWKFGIPSRLGRKHEIYCKLVDFLFHTWYYSHLNFVRAKPIHPKWKCYEKFSFRLNAI